MSSIVLPFYKTPHISIKTSIESVGALPSIQATIACVGHRTQIPGYNVTSSELNPLVPALNFPQLQYFFPFIMPTFSSGYEALSYMKNLGFTVNFGLSGSLAFPAPSVVTVNTNSTVTLSYLTPPANYSLLSVTGVSATITQLTSGAMGIFQSTVNNLVISSVTYPANIILSGISGTFVTTALDTITVAYINNNLGLPDPNRTEEICMQVFYIYQVMNNIVAGGQYNFVKPAVFLSVLSDRETGGSFSPNATPFALGVPSAVAVSGSNTLIGYATIPTTAGYVPLQALGNTLITQVVATASAILIGVLPAQIVNGVFCEFVIEVGITIDPFNATNILSCTLDATQNVFVLMDQLSFTCIVDPYDVATNTDISTNQATFFDYIASTNQPTEVEKGHFGVFGVFANTSIVAQQMSTLPTGVNGLVAPGNWLAPVYYPYIPNVGEYPQSSAVIAAGYASFFSCNTAPYNPQSLITIPAILSSANTQNRVVYGLTGATSSEIALDLGWSPLCVNTSGGVFPARLITGQVTLPQTNVIDEEFFPLTTWQIVTYFQQQIYVALIAAGVKQLRQTPQVLTNVRGIVIGIMSTFQLLGMFENVNYWAKKVTVTESNIPDTILIQVPAQIIPELASAYVQVGLISSLISVPST
jgi:hypothetical protein